MRDLMVWIRKPGDIRWRHCILYVLTLPQLLYRENFPLESDCDAVGLLDAPGIKAVVSRKGAKTQREAGGAFSAFCQFWSFISDLDDMGGQADGYFGWGLVGEGDAEWGVDGFESVLGDSLT